MTTRRIFFALLIMVFFLPTYVSAQEAPPQPNTPDAEQIDFANGLFSRGLYQMALTEYQEFLEKYPNNPKIGEAQFAAGECLFFAKDYDKAIESYNHYIEGHAQGEKVNVAILRVGQSFFLKESYEEALLNFSQVDDVVLDQKFKQILYFYTGKSYRARGQFDLALENFNKTVEVLKESKFYTVYAYYEIGDILTEEQNYEQAIGYYEKTYEGAISKKVQSIAFYKKGEIQFLSKNYPAAIETFKAVIEKYPTQDIMRDALSNLLLSYFNLEEYDNVITQYKAHEATMSSVTDFFGAHFIAASAFAELERYDESLSLMEHVLSDPSLKEADRDQMILKKAEVLVKSNQFQEAVDFASQVPEGGSLPPDQLAFLSAEAEYGLKKYQEALNNYKKVYEGFPDSTLANDALYGMAHSHNGLNQIDEAVALFYEYFGKDKEDAGKRQEALYNAILIASKNDRTDKAIEYSEMFLSAFSEYNNDNILFLLGTLYPKKEMHAKAVQTFELFIGKYPNSDKVAEAHFLLGYNLQHMEKLDEALVAYGEVPNVEEDNTFYYSALKNSASIYLKRDEKEKASEMFNQLVTDFEDNDIETNTYVWLAERFIEEKKFEEVIRVLDKASAKVQKGETDITSEAIAFYKGEAMRETNQCDKALVEYAKVIASTAVEKDGKSYSGPAVLGKCLCLAAAGQFDQARKQLEQTIMDYPNDPTLTMRARFQIGNLERGREQWEEANKFYMLVAVLYKDPYYSPQALFNAGELLEQLGRKKEAEKVYSEITELYAESHIVNKAKERLETLSAG